MKAFIEAIVWTALNVLGGWLVVVNLFEVGRLGAAAAGFLVILSAWVWLAWTVVAAILRKRALASKPVRS